MISSTYTQPRRKKVAIVGSGSAGLAALWALNRTHHDVYLYESTAHLGGETKTFEWRQGRFKALVDTGLMFLNRSAYPNFLAFLRKVGVRTEPTEFSFKVCRADRNHWLWSGNASIQVLLARARDLLSPRIWRVVLDTVRFNQTAIDILLCKDSRGVEETICQFLDREGYSNAFRDDYLLPLVCSLQGLSPVTLALEIPAVSLIRFLYNHNLISPVPSGHPQWLAIQDGSKTYIDSIMRGFPSNHIFLNSPVKSLAHNVSGRLILHLESARTEMYDHIILAVPVDQAYSIMHCSATDEEHSILSRFRTLTTTAVLHSDVSLLPKAPSDGAGCNLLTVPSASRDAGSSPVLTYNINTLQHIPTVPFNSILLTLSSIPDFPAKQTVQSRRTYSQPILEPASLRAQSLLPLIQNRRGISYAGAWTTGSGTFEDGFSSGLRVAQEHLGARLPFPVVDEGRERPELGKKDYALRLGLLVALMWLRVVKRVVTGFWLRADRLVGGVGGLSGARGLEKKKKKVV